MASTGGKATSGSATAADGGEPAGGLNDGGAGAAQGGGAGAGSSAVGGASGGLGGSGGGSAGGGAGPLAGSGSGGVSGGGAAAGGGGAAGSGGAAADPCEGVAHWSPTDKITDYTTRPNNADGSWRGDLRVFGGILWAAQAAQACQTYPGHGDPSGWIKIATCAGGPVDETAACQCAAGTCCDGCYLRGQSYFCGETVRTSQCLGPVMPQCGVAQKTIDKDYANLFCDGLSAGDCTRWGPHTKYSTGTCPATTGCLESGDQAECAACQ